ncbi:MAG: diguanylate cyclase [Campylobacterota bacterium]|nr:diguanylate cyclase [Campylobacterota bacterium]
MNKELLNKITILYVEDEEEILQMSSKILKNVSKECQIASNGVDGLEKFKEHFFDTNKNDFDVIVTDINMPQMNGLDMLQEIKKLDAKVPIVITTAHTDSTFLRESIELGVRGYAVKPISLEYLLNSIEIAVESRILEKELEHRVEMRTKELNEAMLELKKKTIELEYFAIHDDLTKLYNRKKFNEELEKEFTRQKRYKLNLSIMMIDIDHFKYVNDNCGHNFGDEVLIEISNLLQKNIRKVDTLCRWGGEEFMILLPETSLENTGNVAKKIKNSIEENHLSCKSKITTISIGVTTVLQDDTIDTLLSRADELLYKAKSNGRNCIEIG